MQSELGGLFYDMAIRDHVRMEVLVQRAAALQRVDAELAQVEHALQSGPVSAAIARASERSTRACRLLPPVRGTPGRPMTGRTLSRRADGFVLVLLAVASAMATAVVIDDASGSSQVRLAVLAAARGRALESRAALVAALGARTRPDAAAAPSVTADAGAGDGGGSPPADTATSRPSGATDTSLAAAPVTPAPTPTVRPRRPRRSPDRRRAAPRSPPCRTCSRSS